MRVLILSAILAVAAGAPSGPAPLTAIITPSIALPASLPTIPPGDLQAAAINAQVEAEDRARSLADQERELADQAAQNIEEKVTETNDEVKTKSGEEVWAIEEKKWQALEAVNTAQAKLEGSVASIQGAMANFEGAVAGKAEELAKSAISGVILAPAPIISPISPIISPLLYGAPGFIAPIAKIDSPKVSELIKTEEPVPALVTKSALLEGSKNEELKPVEVKKEEKPVSIPLESILSQPLALAAPWPLGLAPIALPYAASTTLVNGQLINGQILTPTVLKTQW